MSGSSWWPGEPLQWPADVTSTPTAARAVAGMYAVHEAAHAVVALRLGISIDSITVHPHGLEGFTSVGTPADAATEAVIAAAAQPAVERYMASKPIDWTRTSLNELNNQFAMDDLTVSAHPTDPAKARSEAARHVHASWSQILGLAQRICDNQGQHTRIEDLAALDLTLKRPVSRQHARIEDLAALDRTLKRPISRQQARPPAPGRAGTSRNRSLSTRSAPRRDGPVL